MTLWMGVFKTKISGKFHVFANAKYRARELLREAWAIHCEQTGADKNEFSACEGRGDEGILFVKIGSGTMLRGYQVLNPRESQKQDVSTKIW